MKSKDVTKLLNISKTTLSKYIKQGKIKQLGPNNYDKESVNKLTTESIIQLPQSIASSLQKPSIQRGVKKTVKRGVKKVNEPELTQQTIKRGVKRAEPLYQKNKWDDGEQDETDDPSDCVDISVLDQFKLKPRRVFKTRKEAHDAWKAHHRAESPEIFAMLDNLKLDKSKAPFPNQRFFTTADGYFLGLDDLDQEMAEDGFFFEIYTDPYTGEPMEKRPKLNVWDHIQKLDFSTIKLKSR